MGCTSRINERDSCKIMDGVDDGWMDGCGGNEKMDHLFLVQGWESKC